MDKKLRFGDLVRDSGRPQVLTLWTKPEENSALMAAIKKQRVLTVIQEPGKRDYGVIGFRQHAGASYLVFPRPLPQAPETRVVGINYQLFDEPVIPKALRVEPTATVLPKQKPPATLVKPLEPKPTPPKPAIRRFKVTVRRSATVENEIHVTATNQAAAEREAIEKVKGKPLRVPGTEVRLEVVQTV